MTSNAYSPLDVYRSYPEQDPYSLNPPAFNLIPLPDPAAVWDTPELRQAALNAANKQGRNPFHTMHHCYPFLLAEVDIDRVLDEPVPLTEYREPPPLAKIDLPENVQFVRQINEHGNTPTFVVRMGDTTRLLKVVSVPTSVPRSSV